MTVVISKANAVLYSVIDFVKKSGNEGKVPEVALSAVLILESFKRKPDKVTFQEALDGLEQKGGSMEKYLDQYEAQ